jgi:predicted ATPase
MSTTKLPIALTSFVGREQETTGLLRSLESSRLITLTGPGGCGKTRLALWLAHKVEESYADGALWVELASVTDASLVPQVLAKALHLPVQAEHTLIDVLVEALQEKQILIVLDNCEHLLKACALLVRTLSQVPGVRLLITSREPLSVEGEALYPVSPLALPPLEAGQEDIWKYDAIRLFVERAQAVVPAFRLTQENQETVTRICRRLDGIPLAIELASARVNLFSIQQIDERLDNRFALLTSSQATEPHHRTLRTAIDWSYDLLSPQEQILFRRLAIFPSSCSIDAMEAVCAFEVLPREQILDLLASLVNKSLVMAGTLLVPQARYWMLESVRVYAKEKLNETGEAEILRNRHLAYFMEQAEIAAPNMRSGDQKRWLNWVETEHDNFRASWKPGTSKRECALPMP